MVACGVPPKDIHATLEGVALAFGITSLILVTLRVLSRVFFLKSGLQLDDIFIIIAMVRTLLPLASTWTNSIRSFSASRRASALRVGSP